MPGQENWRWQWGIVGAVTLLHLAVFGWATLGTPRPPPRKSELTIELGVNQPRSAGAAAAAPAAAPLAPAVPQPAARKPQSPQAVTEASRAPVAGPVPSPVAAPVTAPPSPVPAAPQPAAPSAPATATGPASPSAARAATATAADQPVAYMNNPRPPYPRMAVLQGIEGTVRLQVLVQPDGSTSQVLLGQSSGNESLDRSALETVGTWKFNPARSQGKETAQWISVPITFSLKRP